MFKSFFIYALTAMFGFGGSVSYIPKEFTEKLYCDDIYSGYGTATSHTETLSYDYYEKSIVQVDLLTPDYCAAYGTNACAPTAGSIVTTYYDYYNPNLLPDYTPGGYYNNRFYFNAQNNTVNAMQEELYNLMGTNTIGSGTTSAQFKTGLSTYFTNAGYSLSYTDITSSLTIPNIIQAFEQEKPLVLFLNSYDYYPSGGFDIGDTSYNLTGLIKSAAHVVIACAYLQYEFYDETGLIKTENWLYVSFGDGTRGYMQIDNSGYIDEAYTLNIT